jgi:hypothetical protein
MRLTVLQRRVVRAAVSCALCVTALLSRSLAADIVPNPVSLERGFHLLYNLDFAQAHQVFVSWQSQHPQDPLGPTAEAAGLLFSEFQRLGVLESQFYTNDKTFLNREKVDPDPAVRDRFNAALTRAQTLSTSQLVSSPKDQNALFAMTLSSGLQADYAALIEKRNLPSLHYTREANDWAGKLLAVDPDCYDAHVATGFSKYIIGSMAAPVRWIMRLGGVSGDKKEGMVELQLTADRGRYLGPFARILLAIAYVREKDNPRAREILSALRDEFPKNPLFAREIARLDAIH